MGSSSSNQNKLKGFEAAFLYSDYLIEIDTLLDIKQGWKISSKIQNYPIEERISGFILGVLGLDNSLKANFVNIICGYGSKTNNLNFNALDSSRGLKVRITKKKEKKNKKDQKEPNKLVCLMAGGQQTAISYTENEMMMKFLNKIFELKGIGQSDGKSDVLDSKKYEQIKTMIMSDKIMTERFVDEYILETCQCIVILIKEIKFTDQKYIEDILQRYKDKKKIFIIHYLPDETNMWGVKQFIDLRLKSLFLVRETFIDLSKFFKPEQLKGSFFNRSIFVQQDVDEHVSLINEDERLRVVHLVLAKDNSPAGNSYNIPARKYLEDFILTHLYDNNVFNLAESFEKFLNEKYKGYFRVISKPTEKVKEFAVKTEKKNQMLFLAPLITQDIKMNYFETLNYSITGKPFPFEKHDYIPYQIIEKAKTYEIFLDAPFLQKNKIEVNLNLQESNFQYIIVSGYKIKFSNKENDQNDIFSSNDTSLNEILGERGTAQFGAFELKIPLAPHSVRFKKKIKCSYKNGILSVILQKSSKEFLDIVSNDIPILSKENINLSHENERKNSFRSNKNNNSYKNLLNNLEEEEEEKLSNKADILKSGIKSNNDYDFETSPEKVYDEYENGKINEIEIYKMDSTFKAGYSKE